MEGLTEGRIVHYVLPDGQHRPAIIVKVWRVPDYKSGEVSLPSLEEMEKSNPVNSNESPPLNGCSNLQVFMDSDEEAKYNDKMLPVSWRTSVLYSEGKEPGTWHWIEKA